MTEKQTKITEFIKKHPQATNKEVGDACGCSKSYAKYSLRQLRKHGTPSQRPLFKPGAAPELSDEPVKEDLKPGERRVTKQEGDDTVAVTVRSCDITTLEAALAFAQVDLTVWRVKTHTIKFYEVTMRTGVKTTETVERDSEGVKTGSTVVAEHTPNTYTNCAVHVVLERLVTKEVRDDLDVIIKTMSQYAPKYPMIQRPALPKGEKFLYELAVLADPHIARLSWGAELGTNWDTKIATSVLIAATDELLVRSKPYPIERILLPVGNDTFEADNSSNTTPRNHNLLSVDGRYVGIFERGYDCVRQMIDHCLEVAPVQLIWIPGNHDPHISYHLVRVLEEHYSHCKDVTVDRTPPPRKCVVYGPTFLGFTHGCDINRKDVAAIFMSEFREQIAQCKHIEVHMGHTHTSKETRTLFGNTEIGGVRTRVLQSLSALSDWEYNMGFSNFQAGEAFLWSSINGYAGQFSVPARLPKED